METCNCCVVVLAYIQILGMGVSTWETERYYICTGSVDAFQQPKNTRGYKKAIAKGLREIYTKLICKFTWKCTQAKPYSLESRERKSLTPGLTSCCISLMDPSQKHYI